MNNNKFILDTKKIFLLSEIKNIADLSEIKNEKIITFDYESHKILVKHNIPNLLIDDFINESDLFTINKSSIKFSKWYEESFLNDAIFFNEVNLGKLFDVTFQNYLISFLLKFTALKNIFQLYPNTIFHTSESIFKIMNLFTNNVLLIKSSNNNKISSTSNYSKLNKSNNYYLSLHNKLFFPYFISMMENISKFFSNTKFQSKNKTTLIINFTTRRNKSFLLNFQNFNMNLIKFDRYLPSIWNFDSFRTIKNSNSIIENYSSLINTKTKNHISQTVSLINDKINLMFENDSFLNFFIIDNISFWPIIKDNLKNFFKENLTQSITEIYLIKNLFEKYSFSNILIFNESGRDEKIAIHFAKQNNVTVSCIQHGMLYPSQPDLDIFLGSFPTLSDIYFVWGKINQKYFKNIQITNTKSIQTGCHFYDGIENVENISSDYILVAPAGLQKYTSFHQTISARLNYNNSLEQICKIATKLNKKLIIKIHPGLSLNEENIINKINPDIKIVKSGSMFELIKSCSLLIILGPTSAILESLIVKKPAICVPVNAPNCHLLFKNHEKLLVSLSKLDETIELFFSNDDFHKKLLELGKNFLDDYVTNRGKASSTILEFLENDQLK
jgi:hypothetical protein